ncbi:hypothetical protein RE428_35910 [Marinobacter nanhaiticus D15-8W]|nr:hypothetical protein RE428_35910 [Marinobacter nanhaiticus D15-8W]
MQAQHQAMIVVRHPHQNHPPERPLGQVKRLSRHLSCAGLERGFAISAQLQEFHRGYRIDDLLRLAIIIRPKRRTQALMATGQGIEGRAQGGVVKRTGEADGARQVVSRVAGFQLIDEPQPLLGERGGADLPCHTRGNRQG